jgi:hypothetical protein
MFSLFGNKSAAFGLTLFMAGTILFFFPFFISLLSHLVIGFAI